MQLQQKSNPFVWEMCYLTIVTEIQCLLKLMQNEPCLDCKLFFLSCKWCEVILGKRKKKWILETKCSPHPDALFSLFVGLSRIWKEWKSWWSWGRECVGYMAAVAYLMEAMLWRTVKLGGSTRHLEFGLGPSLYPVSDGRNGLNFLP